MAWGKPREEEQRVQCSLAKPVLVYIEPLPRQKIELLMAEYPHQEWLAYLSGRKNKDSSIVTVEDIHVPPHASVSGASAEAEPFNIPKDCVGVIHSHHSMGAFHSATDHDYVDQNFAVSITVARNNGNLTYDTVSYGKTPCGKSIKLVCLVKFVQPKLLFDKREFLNKAKKNIEKGKATAVVISKYPEAQVYGGDHFIPIRYRLPFVTDRAGNVIPKAELEDIMANSEGDQLAGME